MRPTFQQTFVYILFTKLNELWQLNFVSKMYIKIVKMWDTFCIHFVYISSDLQKVYILKTMFTIWIQNSYRMYIQIIVCEMDPPFQDILTHLLCTS